MRYASGRIQHVCISIMQRGVLSLTQMLNAKIRFLITLINTIYTYLTIVNISNRKKIGVVLREASTTPKILNLKL